MTFDPSRRLVMASFKTVLGHNLGASTQLQIVEEPSARGEVDEALARRLWNSGTAVYAEDYRPTPVETPEQEAARIVAEDPAGTVTGPDTEPLESAQIPADLLRWQADDEEAGKKAGDTVTKDDLLLIAEREEVAVESDDNKPDLIRKIIHGRAARAAESGATG